MSSEANGEVPNAEIAALKLSESPQPSNDAVNNESDSPASFEECFKAFSKFGDTKSDGKLITLSQSDKWMKQAKVIDGKKITTTDTGIYFKKLKSLKVGVVDYQKFLQELAASKKLEVEELKKKLSSCGPPGFTSVRVGNHVLAAHKSTKIRILTYNNFIVAENRKLWHRNDDFL